MQAQEKHLNGPQSLFTQWKTIKILLRSKLFKRLTLCIMLTGVIQEGLQDLMMQYLQLKLDFGIKDQVRASTSGQIAKIVVSQHGAHIDDQVKLTKPTLYRALHCVDVL